jgi:YggT family protein
MLIIERTFWFVAWAIKGVIIAAIALMIIRLIADAMDLNPFGWTSRTVRRLSDPFVNPVRGGLRGFSADPKFAPLVVILIVILLGYFVLQLVEAIAVMASGVLRGVQDGAMVSVIGFILYGLLSIYILLIIIRVIFSWAMLSYTNRVMRLLVDVTEPMLGPLRRIIPRLGWLDISPLVAILILILFQGAVMGTLLRGASIRGF